MMMRRLGLTTMAAAASMRGIGDSTSWQSAIPPQPHEQFTKDKSHRKDSMKDKSKFAKKQGKKQDKGMDSRKSQ
jgi:hypothetical protein